MWSALAKWELLENQWGEAGAKTGKWLQEIFHRED
jgi:hypothetical protein